MKDCEEILNICPKIAKDTILWIKWLLSVESYKKKWLHISLHLMGARQIRRGCLRSQDLKSLNCCQGLNNSHGGNSTHETGFPCGFMLHPELHVSAAPSLSGNEVRVNRSAFNTHYCQGWCYNKGSPEERRQQDRSHVGLGGGDVTSQRDGWLFNG